MRILSDMLEKAIGRPEVLRTARATRALDSWDGIVGPQLAPQCRPVRYDKGTITVLAGGSSYAQEVRMSEERIVAALNEAAGEPLFQDIRVTLSYSGPRTDGG